MRMVLTVGLLGFLTAGVISAQYPGQVPPGQYPPGQYPPGQYPPGSGGGISIPHRQKKSQKSTANAQPTIAADGKTISSDDQKLVIATEDGRTLTMTVTPTTTFTRSGSDISKSKIVPRTTVHIEAAEDDEANLTVVKVELLKDAPPEEETPAAAGPRGQPLTPAQIAAERPDSLSERPAAPDLGPEPNDPNRPVLRRGKPTQQNSDGDTASNSGSAPATQTSKAKSASSAASPKQDSTDFTIDGESAPVKKRPSAADDLIGRTMEWAQTFTQGLPNFVCQQDTTRYLEQSKSQGWQALDVVTAKVVYEDGHEDYKEITVGGKRTSKSMLELGGATSTGEFATVLASLFSGFTNATFKFYQSTTVAGSPAAIYDFKVALHNSDWTIQVGGQSLRPVYSGSVWIDKESAQVRRIEMQADNIPKDFPLDAVESAVDYQPVRLGSSEFLLPTHAENLSCQRGSTICTKNDIDFRDYHKYSGESTIVFK